MGKINKQLLAFNRGIISKLALARIDVPKISLSAEIQTNWLPRLLGSMMLRPGLEYIGELYNSSKAVFIPFIFSKTQKALIEFTENNIRFWVNDELLTRESVTTNISNGNFTSNLVSWADNDEVGAVSSWSTGGYMKLVGTGVSFSRRTQAVNASGNEDIQHGVKIIIERGPVRFRIGSTADNDDFISEITLGTGTHSLSFTPNTSTFYINFFSLLEREVLINSINIESAGVVSLPSPYDEEALSSIRNDQSLDVIFLTGGGLQQRELQRSGNGSSWSIVLYEPEDGPVAIQNSTRTTIAASGLNGNITLVASNPIFKEGHVGSIWKLVSVGQTVSQSVSAENTFTDYIIVSGSGSTRAFTVSRAGTWTATITLQRSFDEGATWEEVITYTGNATITYNDELNEQLAWYRIGIVTGDYSSGTVDLSLSYSLGSITGYIRITEFTSSTLVNAEVLKDLGSTNPTNQWSEGEWSAVKGYPSSVTLVEGRLGFAGNGKFIASLSDAFRNFDDETIGDSGLISRNLGSGAIGNVHWMMYLEQLFLGCDTSVKTIVTSYDEPMTPTNFRITKTSTQSCANIPPIQLDKSAIFIQGAGTRVMQLNYDNSGTNYKAIELTKTVPNLGNPSLLRIAIQRQPDTIIHFVRGDGKVVILLFDELENLLSWVLYETDGMVEEVVILPGDIEDNVYYAVKRTVNGVDKRFLEKFSFQNECQGGTLNKQADSFITYSGIATNIISGLDHLEGREVVVWADGKDFSPTLAGVQTTFTVISGQITLPSSVSNAVVGLPYEAQYKSSKLAYASASPLGQKKKVNAIGVILSNTHYKGLQYGRSFEEYDNLPLVNPNTGKSVAVDTVYSELDTSQFSFSGEWNTDSRLCLQAQAPRPCTLLACEIAITTNDKL
tara:strand:- start:454 stop:3141 length:2688 start_codon:yes stop_codon:yes gene_type:complete